MSLQLSKYNKCGCCCKRTMTLRMYECSKCGRIYCIDCATKQGFKCLYDGRRLWRA